jgi:hypothetical protein
MEELNRVSSKPYNPGALTEYRIYPADCTSSYYQLDAIAFCEKVVLVIEFDQYDHVVQKEEDRQREIIVSRYLESTTRKGTAFLRVGYSSATIMADLPELGMRLTRLIKEASQQLPAPGFYTRRTVLLSGAYSPTVSVAI